MVKEVTKNITLVLIGTLVFSIAINSVVIPNHLGEGGVTGVTLLLYYVFDINPSVSNFIINTSLLIVGWRLLEKKTIIYTMLSVVSLSIFLDYVSVPVFIPSNTMLAPLLAGVLIGIGIGIVILGHGTTAGADIIAMIVNKQTGIPISTALLVIDILIIIPLSFVIGLERGIMTVISVYLTSKLVDFVMEGYNPKKALMIVSENYDQIAEEIMLNVDRGITVLKGYGYYSKNEKDILYVVISRLQLMKVQRLINEIDPNAFVTVTGIQQVLGEGFTFHLEERHNVKDQEII
ncbi:YitT family protein [Aerococcaceae bacterium WGS1372]